MLLPLPPQVSQPQISPPQDAPVVPVATVLVAPVQNAEALAFSFDGLTVVGMTTDVRAFAWEIGDVQTGSGGRVVQLDAIDRATSVSDDGWTIAGHSRTVHTDRVEGRQWVGGLPQSSSDLNQPGLWGAILGLSGDGQMAVGSAIMFTRWTREAQNGMHGHSRGEAVRWRWSGDATSRPESLGLGWGSTATAISRDSETIVGRTERDSRGFRWTRESGAETIGDLPGRGIDTVPNAVSGDGSVIVGRALGKDGVEAFRWSAADGMVGLGDLPGRAFRSEAKAVSDDGSLVVGMGTSDRVGESPLGERAFIWDAKHGMRDLHALLLSQGRTDETLPKRFDRWRLTNAIGVRVTADGRAQVAGNALDASGARVIYVATLTEPVAP